MPTKKEQILLKISKILKIISDISYFDKHTIKDIKTDIRLKASLERFLYLSSDSTISLLEMMISYKKYNKATSYSENVDILLENKIIDITQSEYLHKLVGLRNVLSHDYEKLNLDILLKVAKNEIPKLKEILGGFEKTI